jgi:hypothetical protein
MPNTGCEYDVLQLLRYPGMRIVHGGEPFIQFSCCTLSFAHITANTLKILMVYKGTAVKQET